MKKIFTLFAALTMVLSMFAATETVYFVNAQGWKGTIKAYAWEPVQNANWPGAAATKEAKQIGGYDVYSYTAEAGKYANVIFNGTGGQTADLKWTAGKYYVLDGWYTKEEAEAKLGTPIVDEVVYFVNNKKWSKVNAYAWTSNPNAAWPGAAATKEAEQIGGFDVYSYSAAPGTYQKVIFNDGNSNQTSDMVWTAGKYIVNNKWYTKEEAEAALAAPVVTTWTMVGDKALFGTEWDLNNTANDLVKQEDGSWVLTLTNKTLAAKSYEYKAAKDRSWTTTVPGGDNAKLTISKAGQYDITFTLNAAATSVTAKATYIPAKYNVNVTAENGTVEGAGEYEEGKEATLTATPAEGYEFVSWTKGEEVVSTVNPYTFTVTENVTLVANFKEAEPEYQVIEDEITNFVFDTESWPMVCYGGPSEEYAIEVYLVLTEAADGTLSYEDCSVSIMGTDATFIEGTLSNLDVYAPSADAVLRVQWNEEFYELHLAMSAAAEPTEPTNVLVTNAVKSYDEGSGALKLTGLWEGAEVFVEIGGYEGKESIEYSTPQGILFETPDVAAFGNEASIIVAGEDITVVCNGLKPMMGNDVYNVTITTLSEVSTALDNLNTTVAPVKMIENGQLIIVKDGVQYNAQGAILK